MDIAAQKYDIRIISGSTLPINRWAYLEELKQLMQMGVVDDVAVLAETDIRNKDKIVQRKSLYAQLQGQIQQLSEVLKDREGTIETLERQLVQAGIKQKVMQADVEINKQKEQIKTGMKEELIQTEGEQKLLRGLMGGNANLQKARMGDIVQNVKKDLENTTEN